MSKWEEALGKTQNMLEGLCVPSELAISQDSLGGAGEYDFGSEVFLYFLDCCLCDSVSNKQKTMDG